METAKSLTPDFPSSKEIAEEIRSELPEGATIAFVSGNFNVVHPGHVRLLSFAKDTGACLVVGVNPDTAPGVSVPAEWRLEGVRSIKLVDHAFVLSEDLETVILTLKPDFIVKGREHEGASNPEADIVQSYGGRLLFSSGDMRFSSVNMLEWENTEPVPLTVHLPDDYLTRHGFTLPNLLDLTASFIDQRVLVIGDLIVDDYIDCDPLGMSQEDPSIVVTPIDTHRFVGGAGIVAAHAAGLGAKVRFLSVAGEDDVAGFCEERLEEFGVEHSISRDSSRPTTLKQRYRSSGKTLLRVSHLRQHAIEREVLDRIVAEVEGHLATTDLMLLSDFNYGCLPQALIDHLADLGQRHGVTMAADSQASSQLADISRFKNMKLITPTELEARLALKNRTSGLAVVAEDLRKAAQCEYVVITLGSDGLLVHAPSGGDLTTDRLPSLNSAPRDVAGAGDCLFACSSLALSAGADIWQSVYLGAVAAACQVSRVGNTPLSSREIKAEIRRFM